MQCWLVKATMPQVMAHCGQLAIVHERLQLGQTTDHQTWNRLCWFDFSSSQMHVSLLLPMVLILAFAAAGGSPPAWVACWRAARCGLGTAA